VLIEFRGAAVDVGTVKFALAMDMPGDWTAQPQYDGPRGSGQIRFTVNVRP
jgi:hypothetical protein